MNLLHRCASNVANLMQVKRRANNTFDDRTEIGDFAFSSIDIEEVIVEECALWQTMSAIMSDLLWTKPAGCTHRRIVVQDIAETK